RPRAVQCQTLQVAAEAVKKRHGGRFPHFSDPEGADRRHRNQKRDAKLLVPQAQPRFLDDGYPGVHRRRRHWKRIEQLRPAEPVRRPRPCDERRRNDEMKKLPPPLPPRHHQTLLIPGQQKRRATGTRLRHRPRHILAATAAPKPLTTRSMSAVVTTLSSYSSSSEPAAKATSARFTPFNFAKALCSSAAHEGQFKSASSNVSFFMPVPPFGSIIPGKGDRHIDARQGRGKDRQIGETAQSAATTRCNTLRH